MMAILASSLLILLVIHTVQPLRTGENKISNTDGLHEKLQTLKQLAEEQHLIRVKREKRSVNAADPEKELKRVKRNRRAIYTNDLEEVLQRVKRDEPELTRVKRQKRSLPFDDDALVRVKRDGAGDPQKRQRRSLPYEVLERVKRDDTVLTRVKREKRSLPALDEELYRVRNEEFVINTPVKAKELKRVKRHKRSVHENDANDDDIKLVRVKRHEFDMDSPSDDSLVRVKRVKRSPEPSKGMKFKDIVKQTVKELKKQKRHPETQKHLLKREKKVGPTELQKFKKMRNKLSRLRRLKRRISATIEDDRKLLHRKKRNENLNQDLKRKAIKLGGH